MPPEDEGTYEESAVDTAPVQTEVAEADLFDDPDLDRFPREYVEKLRAEAADYRTKYQPYRDTFNGVEDPDVLDYVLDLNKKLLSDDKSEWVAEVKELLKSLDPADAEALSDATGITPGTDEDDLDRPLTRRELMEERQREEAQAAEKAGIAKIHNELKDLGYAQGREDKYGDTAAVISLASLHTGGDLQKAHQLRAERFATAVEEAVNAKLEEIRSGSAGFPAMSSGSSAGQIIEGPKTFADAKKRAHARLTANVGE